MKTPSFWYKPQGLLSTFLWPLGWLYEKGGQIRVALKKREHFSIPILSVGNIVCGGAGKTPTAIALKHLLQEQGYNVHFVTRGYGGREKGPVAVNTSYHKACDVGDEPLLLAQHAPTWVAKNRLLGIEEAIKAGADLIILDDGHQTTGVYKDLSFVVVDLLQGFGNACVIPAGPLRENLKTGLMRADGIIMIGEEESLSPSSFRDFTRNQSHPEKDNKTGLPHFACNNNAYRSFFKAKILPQPLTLPTNRVVAFCGLGFPKKFYMSLENAGFELVATESFPDHYQYQAEDLIKLQKLAQNHQGVLVTTRKDLIKIPPSWQDQLHVLDISIQFEDPKELCKFILQKIHPLKESA